MLDFKSHREILANTSSTMPSAYCLGAEIEEVFLPSQGMFFSGAYKNIKKVKVKKLSWVEENILTTPSYYGRNVLLKEILSSSIMDPNFPIEELIEIDLQAIIIWLRIGAFGVEYKLKTKCQHCDQTTPVIWNLGTLSTSDISTPILNELTSKGSYTIILPHSKALCELTPTSIKNLDECTTLLDAKEVNEKVKFLSCIKKITHLDKVYDTLEAIHEWMINVNLSIVDRRFVLKEKKNIDIVIEKQFFKCEKCKESSEYSFPFSEDFFGLSSPEYRDYLDESINYLNFWGKLDYQSILHMPTYKRRIWCDHTSNNLKKLFPKPK